MIFAKQPFVSVVVVMLYFEKYKEIIIVLLVCFVLLEIFNAASSSKL